MRKIWKEKITIGSYEVADYYDEEDCVHRYERAIQVRAKAWYDKKTRTLRIDLDCVRALEYVWRTADSPCELATWDEYPPQRTLTVLEPMSMAAIYRMIAGIIDDYETEATQCYVTFDLTDRRSDDEVKADYFKAC